MAVAGLEIKAAGGLACLGTTVEGEISCAGSSILCNIAFQCSATLLKMWMSLVEYKLLLAVNLYQIAAFQRCSGSSLARVISFWGAIPPLLRTRQDCHHTQLHPSRRSL